jgi:hypothetical protein
VYVCVTEREIVFMCVCVCVWQRKIVCLCVYLCARYIDDILHECASARERLY